MSAAKILTQVLIKNAADQPWYNKSLLGGEDKPFTQTETVTDPAVLKARFPVDTPTSATATKSLPENYVDALKRGHLGTVVGTGAAAILGGVLAYNMLKKKRAAK